MSGSLTLGITNIGDLLLNNKISKAKKDENDIPIENIDLRIPVYQRPYKWDVENALQLLDDILNAENENNKKIYRVGTLILYKDKDETKNEYEIVDGQQRIITFSLLLKALQEVLKKNDKIEFLDQEPTDNPYNKYNIRNNYLAISRRIDSFKEENSRIYNYILGKCELVVIITKDQSEAFQFFDSQNARGKELYPHDLLKAYHLREMNDLNEKKTNKTVEMWQDLDQNYLSYMFSKYLYRIKEWSKGNEPDEQGLNEQNIYIFKGITQHNNYPYAQFFKGAYFYSNTINKFNMPFVTGMKNLKSFQINAPIIAGKPFFDYAQHYYKVLKDIQNNCNYKGYYLNDNEIIKTLNLQKYKDGSGNELTRELFNSAILLYIDRFCPEKPARIDVEMFEQFVIFAFIWAYSLRAQSASLGWKSVRIYIACDPQYINSFNIYKKIAEADSPVAILHILSNKLLPLSLSYGVKKDNFKKKWDQYIKDKNNEKKDPKPNRNIIQNYLYYFEKYKFVEDNTNGY